MEVIWFGIKVTGSDVVSHIDDYTGGWRVLGHLLLAPVVP